MGELTDMSASLNIVAHDIHSAWCRGKFNPSRRAVKILVSVTARYVQDKRGHPRNIHHAQSDP